MIFKNICALLFSAIFVSVSFGQNFSDKKDGVIEISVYTVKQEYLEEFSRIRAKILDVLKTFKGFRSITTRRSIEQPNTFSEIIEWECKEDCDLARMQAENMPELQPFMNAIEKSLLFEFFVIEKKVQN